VTKIAAVTEPECIFQFIEAPGFMDDPSDENSLVPTLSGDELAAREQQVEGRMKRKMLALCKLFDQGGTKVIISDGRTEHPLLDAINGHGTTIS